MGKIFIMTNHSGGGGGADTSVVTATASDVLVGKIIVDAEGEPVIGTMPNIGAASQILDAGESYTIPAGYHNGSGKVTVQSLATMTASGDATASQILSGKKAYVDGSLITGSMPNNTGVNTNGSVPGVNSSYPTIPTREGSGLQIGVDTYGVNRIHLCPPEGYYQGGGGSYVNRPAADFGNAAANQVISGATFTSSNGLKLTGTLAVQSVLSFNAAPYSTNQITCSWKNPAKGAFSGVIICGRSDGTYPTDPNDNRWYKGSGNNTAANGTSTQIISGLAAGTTYYIKIFSYAIKDNTEWIHATTYTATVKTTTKGTKTFTSSTTWTVPTGVRSIDIFCVGGGGAAGDVYGTSKNSCFSGGGGGGYTATKKAYAVTPGSSFTVTIGAGGSGIVSGTGVQVREGNPGGATSFGSVVSASGGKGGKLKYNSGTGSGAGGAGGSGGGEAPGGNGGSNGSNGANYFMNGKNGGAGQGTTTRAFGETSNTLYAGGGGAGGTSGASCDVGTGGSGGGGNGGDINSVRYASGANGTANTGGGAGGSACRTESTRPSPASGGSGICIIRWGY